MIEIVFSSSFKRAFRKVAKNKSSETRFWKRTQVFIEDPFHPTLKTHRLSGKLRHLWSFSIEYDLRVIFYFEEKNTVVFVDIGTHNEVY